MRIVLFALLFVLLGIFVDHEYLRYKESLAECQKRRGEDIRLLNGYCIGSDAQTATCREADRRTLLSVAECARNRWRVTSVWCLALGKFVDSYWSMYLIIVPITGLVIYLYMRGRFEQQNESMRMEKQIEFAKQIASNPFQMKRPKKRRRQIAYDPEDFSCVN